MKDHLKIATLIFACLLSATACQHGQKERAVFSLLSPAESGIDFNNTIVESDSFNMYTFMNIYTGGGVAVGDINNDGLEDIFFSGNRVSSRLYLNQGNLQFKDITESAGLQTNRWCAGASMVDLNQDGFLDIYISVSGVGTAQETSNLLFINSGNNTFNEQAEEYGLADTAQTMHASFFDYDRDGDLDIYCIVNPVNFTLANVNRIKDRMLNGESESTDHLYRNNGDLTFTNVSKAAGILVEGYSLGIATSDINQDGWPDIYISNDFLTNDILYLNNQDGTFTNQAAALLKHTSFAGMGNDVADMNNDGRPDIYVADMLPEDNLRRQTIIPASSYDKFQLTVQKGYERQHTRNTLQINNGDGSFSEIGQLAGIDQTDWSWSTLFADYDNDGDKDLFVTNGFLRDVGNLDYIQYQRQNNSPFGKKETSHKKRLEAIEQLGAAKIENYVFENLGDLTFAKKNKAWGIPQKTCSNGAAFADLDQDGDLDMIINNVNDPAFIYRNNSDKNKANHFIKLQLKGGPKNQQGIGAKISILTAAESQYYEHTLYRGYESTVSQEIHFGLGKDALIEQINIQWPDGKKQQLLHKKANQTLVLHYQDATESSEQQLAQPEPIYALADEKLALDYLHQENDFVDFKVQALLPHQHSKNGPGMAVGDINGDGLEDAYIGGAAGFAGQFFIQNEQNSFDPQPLLGGERYEDMGSLLFDADADGDLDLYLSSGGSAYPANSERYQDRFYLNDGQGNFTPSPQALPEMYSSTSCVTAADYDRDGDLDLFVGGRIIPGAYPMPAKSYLLRNDTKGQNIQFTIVNKKIIPELEEAGLVCTALWTDYDNDGWLDLMIAGEWMPISLFQNKKGQFTKVKNASLAQSNGWWNSLVSGDFDRDGDLDYIGGNRGLNSRYNASVEEPLTIYASDFDKNGRIDPVLCHYIEGIEYIAHPRDQLVEQINAMRVRFKTYKDYAATSLDRSFTAEELEAAYVVQSQTFASSYIENLGDGNFDIRPLPMPAQFAPVFGMQVVDFDEDGHLDLVLVGNSYATEVALGRYDAGDGLLLKGDGTGAFEAISAEQSGFKVDKDAKAMVHLQGPLDQQLLLISSNADRLTVYQNKNTRRIPILANDLYALLHFDNGDIQKKEFYYGAGYLSQSSRSFAPPSGAGKIEIVNNRGEKRQL